MDWSSLLLWISITFSFIYVLILLLARKKKPIFHGNLPPGPVPLPIVGSLFKLGNKPNESLAHLAKLHGPLMTIQLGSLRTVVISSADMANEVLQKKDQSFAGRTVVDAVQVPHYAESSMAWSQLNPHWRKLRMMCNTHIFTTQRLDASQDLRRRKVQDLVAHVLENCGMGQAVHIGKAAFATTLNLVSNTVFSVDLVEKLSSNSSQEFKDLAWGIMEVIGKPNLSDYFPLLRLIDPQSMRRQMTSYLRELNALFDRLIDQRLLLRSSLDFCRRNDFLDVLLDHSGQDWDHHEIKALFTDIFVAGSETSSSTLEWAMAELLRNPRTMAKARSEIKATIGSEQEVQESDISRLPYLQAVVKETLRLHPPAPLLLPHRAESDVEMCGFIIPKHTQVMVNAWAISRDADAWVNPTSFEPERFMGSPVDFRGQDFTLIPFGAGRRICPGLPLAHRMVHLMLASLLHSFAWKLPNGMTPDEMDMSDKFGLTLQMVVPLHVIPVEENEYIQ